MIGQPRSSGGSFSFFFCLAIERSSGANVAVLDSSESSLRQVFPSSS